jgi:hypothetical protein
MCGGNGNIKIALKNTLPTEHLIGAMPSAIQFWIILPSPKD